MTAKSDHHMWILRPRPNSKASVRLFCFPYAGGNSTIYHKWLNRMPQEIELCLVQLPGRECRLEEPPPTQLASLVEPLAQALEGYLDRPFALFGYSMGGLISFELARYLRSQARVMPQQLFIAAACAPHLPSRRAKIHHLPDAEFIEALRQLNGTPEAVLDNAELMQIMLPMLRADFTLCETYQYHDAAPLDCPISVFGGLGDHEVSREQLAGWRNHTAGRFTLRMFPGDHFFLHTDRTLLLQALYQDLAQWMPQVRGHSVWC